MVIMPSSTVISLPESLVAELMWLANLMLGSIFARLGLHQPNSAMSTTNATTAPPAMAAMTPGEIPGASSTSRLEPSAGASCAGGGGFGGGGEASRGAVYVPIAPTDSTVTPRYDESVDVSAAASVVTPAAAVAALVARILAATLMLAAVTVSSMSASVTPLEESIEASDFSKPLASNDATVPAIVKLAEMYD